MKPARKEGFASRYGITRRRVIVVVGLAIVIALYLFFQIRYTQLCTTIPPAEAALKLFEFDGKSPTMVLRVDNVTYRREEFETCDYIYAVARDFHASVVCVHGEGAVYIARFTGFDSRLKAQAYLRGTYKILARIVGADTFSFPITDMPGDDTVGYAGPWGVALPAIIIRCTTLANRTLIAESSCVVAGDGRTESLAGRAIYCRYGESWPEAAAVHRALRDALVYVDHFISSGTAVPAHKLHNESMVNDATIVMEPPVVFDEPIAAPE